MAENARNGANGGSGVGGGAGDDPPRRNSNMNGSNRSSVRFGGSEPVGKKLALSQRGSNATDTTDEEAKLLQQQQQQNQFKVAKGGSGVGGGTDIGVDSGGGGDGVDECGENGDLVKGKDGIEVSVIDIAEGAGGVAGAGGPFKPGKSKKGNAMKAFYDRVLTTFEVSKKSERPFVTMFLLILLLVLVVIILAALWPRIPSYLTKEVCLEAECLEASKQILSWARPDANTCRQPYVWACGRFEDKYQAHNFYGVNKGEWNYDAYQDYEETAASYEFISKLPTVAMSYSAQYMIKKLHQICTTVETVSNNEAITSLKRALKNLGGWRMLLGNNNPHWDLRENLQKVQPKYGAAPFYKLGIETRNAPPYDVIITVSEGDLGLPSKEFYTLDERHSVITAYHTYLRDILAHMVASSTTKSQEYAKMIYNYERRIALDVMGVLRDAPANASQPQIRTMQQLADEAPSLPILQTAQAMFRRKITENTQVLVSSPIALKMISQIITTTDKEILNNFVMWSVIRHFVPYMSHNFRQSLLEFEKALYGVQHKQPIWHFCTKVVQQWMPYGLEALRENPKLVVHERESVQEYGGGDDRRSEVNPIDPYHSSQQVQEDMRYDEELVRLIFYHIRDEYKSALNNANWVNQQLTKYIADKLSMMRVQIGIPAELLKSERTVNEFYNDVVLDELLFVDNVVTHWEFVKKRMDRMMDNGTENERIAAELFPPSPFGSRRPPVANLKYSVGLNMVIISKEKTREPYFHYKYPLSLNFARLGADISLVIHDAVNTLAEQFRNVETSLPRHILENVFDEEAQKCMTKKLSSVYLNTAHISNATKLHSYLELSATSLLSASFQSLLDKITRNERIYVADIPEKSTYETLGLRTPRRQPGLQRYDEQQLFALAFLQKHCAVPDKGALRFSKILVENYIPEADKFSLLWRHVPALADTLDCDSSSSSGSEQSGHCGRVL